MTILVVVEQFLNYPRGAVISDPDMVAAYLNDHPTRVVKTTI